jgi:hypothetical protein
MKTQDKPYVKPAQPMARPEAQNPDDFDSQRDGYPVSTAVDNRRVDGYGNFVDADNFDDDRDFVQPVQRPVAALANYHVHSGSVRGRAGRGPVPLSGVMVGDSVLSIAWSRRTGEKGNDAVDAFESVISVKDQIQQLDDADLSDAMFEVKLGRKDSGMSPAVPLDGKHTLRPVPFDAHEQIVRRSHSHSLAEGYRPLDVPGAGSEDYVPQEYPKHVVVGQDDDGNDVTAIANDADHEAQLTSSKGAGQAGRPADRNPSRVADRKAGDGKERRVFVGSRRAKVVAVKNDKRKGVADRRVLASSRESARPRSTARPADAPFRIDQTGKAV